MIKKTGMYTIAGRPNVGKSTLLNALIGEKIAIVSNKPQTTRTRISGALNRGESQLIFMDTPGFHKPKSRLGSYMVGIVRESVAGVDALILMVEPIASVGTQERLLIEQLQKAKVPAILVINKIDTVKKEELLKVIEVYAEAHDFAAIIPVSARRKEGLEELLDELEGFAEEGPALFPEDMISDQPEKQLLAEIFREKMLYCLDKEIPHGVATEISRLEETESGIVEIEVTIYCEKSSHKGIIIGKNGAMLKKMGELARKDMEQFLGTKVFLETWVKVKENWRDNQYLLRNFGFE